MPRVVSRPSDRDRARPPAPIPIPRRAQARNFVSLLADLEATQKRIRAGLARLDPAKLSLKPKPESKRTLGESLHFMAFHEAYHAGQLGLPRCLAGKPGAI